MDLKIYTIEYYSATKKTEILSIVTMVMELESIMLHEINQAQKGKKRMISLLGEILKEKKVIS